MPDLRRLFDIAARRTSVGGQTLLARMQTAANSTSVFASALVDDIAGDVAAILGDLNTSLDDLDGTAAQGDAETAAALNSEKISTAIAGTATDVQQTQLNGPAPTQLLTAFEFVANWLDGGDGDTLLSDLFGALTDDAAPASFFGKLNTLDNTVEPNIRAILDDMVTAGAFSVEFLVGNIRSGTSGEAGAHGNWASRIEQLIYPNVTADPVGSGDGFAYGDPPTLSQMNSQTEFGLDGYNAGVSANSVGDFRAAVSTTTTGPGYGGDATNDPLSDLLDYCTDNLAQ